MTATTTTNVTNATTLSKRVISKLPNDPSNPSNSRRFKGARKTSTEAVKTYRAALREMGVSVATTYIPEERREEFMLIAERMRAEHYVAICELPVSDQRRIVLAERNYTEIPSLAEVNEMGRQLSAIKGVKREYEKQLNDDYETMKLHHNKYFVAIGAMSVLTVDSSDEVIKFASIAVASSAYTKVLWKQLKAALADIQNNAVGG